MDNGTGESLKYDLIIIGGGPGGYTAAIKASRFGMKTALIEKDLIGGTCLNRGCIPTKALIHSAECYRSAKSFADMGIHLEGLCFDMTKIDENKNQIVSSLREGVEHLLSANKVDIYRGRGVLSSPTTVRVDGDSPVELTGERIIIACGGVPALPRIQGIERPGVLTSDEILEKAGKSFGRLAIVGGGVIGVEFAQIYNALDCEVTIIEAMPRILSVMDREISQSVAMVMKNRGVKIYTTSQVTDISGEEGSMVCRFEDKTGASSQVECDGVLVAIGRKPVGETVIDPTVPIQIEGGRIVVNSYCQTNIESIYAIGDVTGGLQLAHRAAAQGMAAVSHIAGMNSEVNMDWIPSCLYTSPEAASVGITADEAKKRGINASTGKYIMTGNGRNVIEGKERGFIKVVFDTDSKKLLGAQLFCPRATDLIGEIAMAGANGLTVEDMLKTIHPHPTFVEGIGESLENVFGRSTHTL